MVCVYGKVYDIDWIWFYYGFTMFVTMVLLWSTHENFIDRCLVLLVVYNVLLKEYQYYSTSLNLVQKLYILEND